MQEVLEETTRAFYRRSLAALRGAGVAHLVGGAYALARYTGIERHTKDLDIFVRGKDLERTLEVLEEAGYPSELTFPHWLGKAFCGDDLVDVIHSSGNALAVVDDQWFEHAVPDEVLGARVELCPPEEMIWSKAFIMERERYDGADVLHLLRARAASLDWERLLRRFGGHYRVLLSHLILFGFVYPSSRELIPEAVMSELLRYVRAEHAAKPPDLRICRGTLLSRAQYLVDVHDWGYEDARHDPDIPMTHEHIAQWTAAITASDEASWRDEGNVRLAAVGDLHCAKHSRGALRGMFSQMAERADVILLCGDLTDYGLPEEAHILREELRAAAGVPMIAVLGNHDHESGHAAEVSAILEDAGVAILEGSTCEVRGVGFAGAKGFAGGFGTHMLAAWGEASIKAFVHEAVEEALRLETALTKLQTPERIALLHYAPIAATVEGEPPALHAFLGTSRLEEALNRHPVSLVVHGHAHRGSREGRTSTGVPVYNVAMPLLRMLDTSQPPFRLLELGTR